MDAWMMKHDGYYTIGITVDGDRVPVDFIHKSRQRQAMTLLGMLAEMTLEEAVNECRRRLDHRSTPSGRAEG